MERQAVGDTAWRIRLDAGADAASSLACLRGLPNVLDAVVADGYAFVRFSPDKQPPDPLPFLASAALVPAAERRTHIVHVRYDGPDLSEVADLAQLPTGEVIALHSGREYAVEVIGFLPGFAYLGPVPPELQLIHRRPAPRLRVPAGSVAIAAGRTAIYPFASPGGWNLIGTAIDFEPFAFRLGDRVRFEVAP